MGRNSKILNWDNLIQDVDNHIRKGQNAQAKEVLLDLNLKSVPRTWIVQVAQLLRRAHLPILGLKIMTPYIRPKTPIHPPTQTQEWAIYAALLIKIGALAEAEKILGTQTNEDPRILFYLVNLYVVQWDYASTIPLLKKYIKHPKTTDYEKLIGKVNLLAAYNYECKWQPFNRLWENTYAESMNKEYLLLTSNCLELKAQTLISQKCYAHARDCLSKALGLIDRSNTKYELYLRKWICQCDALEGTKPISESIKNIKKIRDQAEELAIWETVRQCDYYLASITQNEDQLIHVLLGTSYPSYNKHLLKNFPVQIRMKKSHLFTWDPKTPSDAPILDVENGSYEKGTEDLIRDSHPHRLLQTLVTDFYRPFFIGKLFSELYPDAQFDALSSPQRVFSVLQSLRKWLTANDVPLKIEVKNNEYRLLPKDNSPIQLRLSWKKQTIGKIENYIQKLKEQRPYQSFSKRDASQILGISESSALKVLKLGLQTKVIFQIGKGRATLYKMKK